MLQPQIYITVLMKINLYGSKNREKIGFFENYFIYLINSKYLFVIFVEFNR